MRSKAAIAILVAMTLSSLSWAKEENHAEEGMVGDLLTDIVDYAANYKPMDTTEKRTTALKKAVDTSVTKLAEVEKESEPLKKTELGASLMSELLDGYFTFAEFKTPEKLKSALSIALPDKPEEDGSKKRDVHEIVRGLQTVLQSLKPEQRKALLALRENKATAEQMGKLAYALKTLAAKTAEKRNAENDSKKIAEHTQTLKALKALEPLFASKIFAALDKEYKETKDKNDYVKNQQNRGAWDIAREWAGNASPTSEVAIAFNPDLKKIADAKSTDAKIKETVSPPRKTASEAPAALPAVDAKPVPQTVKVSFNGPKGSEWVDGVQKEDGVHVTVNYPAGGVYREAKSLDVVHTYKKDSLPKDLKITQSAPISVFGAGFNKSFPTVMIKNEPYIVTKDGYTHYKFVDFFGNPQPPPQPQQQPQAVAATPKTTTSVKPALASQAKEPSLVAPTPVEPTPTLASVTVVKADFTGVDSEMVTSEKTGKAYDKSLEVARAARVGQLKDVKWEKGHEPMMLETAKGPVLVVSGGAGPELVYGFQKNKAGELVPVADCINCNNVAYRELNVFTTGAVPLPKDLIPGDHPPLLPSFEELATKMKPVDLKRASHTTAKPAAIVPVAAVAPAPTTPEPTSPIYISPVDVSTVAYGYRGPQTYYNPPAAQQPRQASASTTASSNISSAPVPRQPRIVETWCPRCNGGRGGYIKQYVW